MRGKFNQIFEEAAARVNAWPEWKKSSALRESEAQVTVPIPQAAVAEFHVSDPEERVACSMLQARGYLLYKKNSGLAVVNNSFGASRPEEK